MKLWNFYEYITVTVKIVKKYFASHELQTSTRYLKRWRNLGEYFQFAPILNTKHAASLSLNFAYRSRALESRSDLKAALAILSLPWYIKIEAYLL